MLDIGEEWPDGEDPGVARYRHFYQVYTYHRFRGVALEINNIQV